MRKIPDGDCRSPAAEWRLPGGPGALSTSTTQLGDRLPRPLSLHRRWSATPRKHRGGHGHQRIDRGRRWDRCQRGSHPNSFRLRAGGAAEKACTPEALAGNLATRDRDRPSQLASGHDRTNGHSAAVRDVYKVNSAVTGDPSTSAPVRVSRPASWTVCAMGTRGPARVAARIRGQPDDRRHPHSPTACPLAESPIMSCERPIRLRP